ncbi:MAG: hypothetical protein AAF362_05620 [Pseudomonadota bacterium]
MNSSAQNTVSNTNTSVGHVLQTVFPKGTTHINAEVARMLNAQEPQETQESPEPQEPQNTDAWETLPVFPFDVFAFCAYFIQITGLMGFFEPDPDPDRLKSEEKIPELRVVLTEDDRKQCKISSKYWYENGKADDDTRNLWRLISDSRNLTIRIRDYQRAYKDPNNTLQSTPKWWTAIFKLLIIADEACAGVGHHYSGDGKAGQKNLGDDEAGQKGSGGDEVGQRNSADDEVGGKKSDGESKYTYLDMMTVRTREGRNGEAREEKLTGQALMVKAQKQFSTLAAAADRGVVCVQPKCRVSEVGCTLRNLSRNLAITGPVGAVRCSWQQLAGKPHAQESDSLNVLLIPMPYSLDSKSFEPLKKPAEGSKWGNFQVRQDWLNRIHKQRLYSFIEGLIANALQDVSQINAVVFPEFALEYALFEELMGIVYEATDGTIEFMISGSSINCDDEESNCVLTAIWESQMIDEDKGTSRKVDPEYRRVRVISQRKHHRWKLNDSQITDYGLASSLPPFINWWEDHNIGAREMNFFQFRRNAVFASLICEDLARNDPCHEIIRSVAPNLIVALLMDGPQLTNRWAARYASSLADDPGSTVLTFTSYGLIERSNIYTTHKNSHSVGLLRDDTGQTREINLEEGHHGVLLTLASKAVTDNTIDDQPTEIASSWHYVNQRSIKLDKTPWDNLTAKKKRRQPMLVSRHPNRY